MSGVGRGAKHLSSLSLSIHGSHRGRLPCEMRSSFQESVAIRSCTVVQRVWRQSSSDSSGFSRRVDNKQECSGIIRHKGYSISTNMWRRLMTQRVHREKNWSDWSREIHDVESRAASRLLVICCLTRDIDHESNVAS
jgi:hypothetical protein